MSDREQQRLDFLNTAGLADAVRTPLAGDASTRRYERLTTPSGTTLMLMDQPPATESQPCDPAWTPAERHASGWNAVARLSAGRIEAFAAVATHLRHAGLSAPEIVAVDAPNQFQIDDLLVGGADAGQLERLLPLLSKNGLLLLATGGQRFGRPVIMPIGRVHYGNIRLAATTGTRFAEALASIPANGELRPGDHVNVVGAGGPMGVMAMVRAIASSQPGSLVEGGVRNPARAEALRQRVAPLAAARGVALRLFNPATETPRGPVHYCFLMAPAPELLGAIIAEAAPRGLINVFAGIAADLPCPIDLDTVAAKQLYFIGTSGSTLEDMHVVLGKVLAGSLDTNLSVGAVSGMAGAIAGLHAVRDKSIAGKIVVYPQLDDLPLLELDALVQRYPTLAPLLADGCWTKAAEDELLRVARTR